MTGITRVQFSPSNVSRDTRPWAREVETRIQTLEVAAQRGSQNDLVTNKAQNSSIALVSRGLSQVTIAVNAALQTATFDATAIVSGVLAVARVPGLDGSGRFTNDVNAGNVTGVNVVSTNLYDANVAFNITAARVAVWGRTADGLIATATSSERFKTDIEPANWPIEKLEAVAGMVSVYYHWIAAVEAAKADPSIPVHTEIGYIAERMHEAGLWEFVVYERGENDELLYDAEHFEATGERVPIPFAIHYSNWAIAVHAVVQHLWNARKADRADIDMILDHLGLTSSASL